MGALQKLEPLGGRVTMQFSPGFRLSIPDTAFVLLLGGFTIYAWISGYSFLSAALATPTLHFFLFCNVFRIRRAAELTWAAFCVALFVLGYQFKVNPYTIAAACGFLGAIVIAVEMRHPSYHGLAWQRINRNLPEWFENHGGGR